MLLLTNGAGLEAVILQEEKMADYLSKERKAMHFIIS